MRDFNIWLDAFIVLVTVAVIPVAYGVRSLWNSHKDAVIRWGMRGYDARLTRVREGDWE